MLAMRSPSLPNPRYRPRSRGAEREAKERIERIGVSGSALTKIGAPNGALRAGAENSCWLAQKLDLYR